MDHHSALTSPSNELTYLLCLFRDNRGFQIPSVQYLNAGQLFEILNLKVNVDVNILLRKLLVIRHLKKKQKEKVKNLWIWKTAMFWTILAKLTFHWNLVMIYIHMYFLLLDWFYLLSFCSILLLRYIEDCSFDLIAEYSTMYSVYGLYQKCCSHHALFCFWNFVLSFV